MTTMLRQKEIIRGKVLGYLGLIYPQSATLPLLQAELDLFGYAVTMDELNSHVAYLTEKTMVTAERVRGTASLRSVTLVKITAKGIDYRDGLLPKDEGIYLEPEN
jgi:hypothetical protein